MNIMEDEERLYYAIAANESELLISYVREQGMDVNTKFQGSNQLNKSLLHLACEKGSYECAEALLKLGARISAFDSWMQTPLGYSISTERNNMTELLVKHGADTNVKDRYGTRPVHFTVGNESIECLSALLKSKCFDIDATNDLGRTAVWTAVSQDGKLEFLEQLILAGADVNLCGKREKQTPLHTAIVSTRTDTLKYVNLLLKAGATPNTINLVGDTPMMSLICKSRLPTMSECDLKVAQVLLQAGYDADLMQYGPNWNHYRGPALLTAAHRGALPITRLLLGAGANPDIAGRRGLTPLTAAVYADHEMIVKVLLYNNCSMAGVGELNIDGSLHFVTAFTCAVMRKHFHLANLLLRAGYNLKEENYLLDEADVPVQFALDLNLWSLARDIKTNPMPLCVLCRAYFRSLFGKRVITKVEQLPVPTSIKHFLLLVDVLGSVVYE